MVLHSFTARQRPDVRVWDTLQGPPLQFNGGQRESSAGAMHAPVPCWHVAHTPEQGSVQQTPPLQEPLWHWSPVVQAAPLPRSKGLQAPFVH